MYYRDKKICGMLIEHSLQGNKLKNSIIGVGININQEKFVSNAPNPVSLYQIIGEHLDLDKALHEVCELIERYTDFRGFTPERFAELHSRYLASLYRCDGLLHRFAVPAKEHADTLAPVGINPDGWEQFDARITDVLPDGMLQLTLPDGTTSCFAFKEVAFVL